MAVPSIFRNTPFFATSADPWSVSRSMDRLLDDIWRNEAAAAAASPRFAPRLEVVENDGEFVLTAELPGLEEKDFHVEVHGKVLSLRGEKRSERSGESEGRAWSERTYGEFRRVVELPAEVDAEKTSASFKNGVLSVTLPKTAAAKVRHVPVTSA
jgi:HSP20 family protein